MNRLNAFENKCLRKIIGIKWNEFKINEEIRKRTKQTKVSETIKKKRWTYVGHILRRQEQRITRQAMNWKATGRRRRGRPKETLRRTLEREAREIGVESMKEIEQLAQDRNVWRNTLRTLCAV